MSKLRIYNLISWIYSAISLALSWRRRKSSPGSLSQVEWDLVPFQFCDINYYGGDPPVGSEGLPHQQSSGSSRRCPTTPLRCRAESLGSSQPLCPSALRHGCEATVRGGVII